MQKITYEEALSRAIDYFHSHYLKTESCWIWTGYTSNGYGRIHKGGFQFSAHRLSVEIHKGKFPKERDVMHACDNPSCVNPDHLSACETVDNIRDMLRKNRGYQGEKCNLSHLTSDNVKSIRKEYFKFKDSLAKKYGVSRPQVENIIRVRSWRYLKD